MMMPRVALVAVTAPAKPLDYPRRSMEGTKTLLITAASATAEPDISAMNIEEGDLAMLIFRTADNLRQIASLSETHPVQSRKALEAIDLILREPVVIPK